MNKLFVAAAIVTAPLAAVEAQAPMTAATYVRMAGASDQYEIRSSQLVLATTRNRGLRDYADMMVRDHNKSTADVKAAARVAGLRPAPPSPDAMGTRNLAALRAVRGVNRDRLYIQQQKASHQKALALHQRYAADGSVRSLRTAAGTIVPVVRHHIAMIERM